MLVMVLGASFFLLLLFNIWLLKSKTSLRDSDKNQLKFKKVKSLGVQLSETVIVVNRMKQYFEKNPTTQRKPNPPVTVRSV